MLECKTCKNKITQINKTVQQNQLENSIYTVVTVSVTLKEDLNGCDHMVIKFTSTIQSVPITTRVVS